MIKDHVLFVNLNLRIITLSTIFLKMVFNTSFNSAKRKTRKTLMNFTYPSAAHFLPIANPIPRDAPVIKMV